MPRSPRILLDGSIHHIYQRGNNGDFILKDPNHKKFLIKQFKDYNKRFDYQLLGYVIMDNHYHLAIKTNRDRIDKIMFNINNVMAKFLNRELQRTGHIYANRYGCKFVDNDAYLVWLLRYIHRNPVRAGICKKVNDYTWSSNIFYQYNISDYIDINYIFNIISPNRSQAINKYLSIMNVAGCDSSSEEDFNLIKKSYEFEEISRCASPSKSESLLRLTLDDILNSVNVSEDLRELIVQGKKDKHLVQYKIEFIKTALLNKYSFVEIGRFLNTTPDALRKFHDYHKISI